MGKHDNDDVGMNKYAVVTSNTVESALSKVASRVTVCPWCGSVSVYSDGQWICPQHGTAPFEHITDHTNK